MIFTRIKNIARAHLNELWSGAPLENPVKETGFRFRQESPPPEPEIPPGPADKESGYYANLELESGASFQEIKSSYRRLMSQYHPDRFSHDEEKRRAAEEVTVRLNEAWSWFKKKQKP